MPQPAGRAATYEDLSRIPENATGEIVAGELVVTPRPSRRHVFATSSLDKEVGPPYQLGRGGPGGWVILVEPELGLGEHILVPDLAGWRRERLIESEEHNWISVTPDWVCEVLSPGTVRLDRIQKTAIYRNHGVAHLWLLDPLHRTLEVYALDASSRSWVVRGLYGGNDRVRAEPFQEIEIELAHLWWSSPAGAG
ncbi:MAG: Uma2 family endonuclease [Thermodesulfobacteriota bacterium]|jgi:Uma2 family endonuclease